MHLHTVRLISFVDDLKLIPREELKRERISCVLQEAMTSLYLLRPLLGQALYLEHTFTNTFNHPLSVSIAWNDSDLKYVFTCMYVTFHVRVPEKYWLNELLMYLELLVQMILSPTKYTLPKFASFAVR